MPPSKRKRQSSLTGIELANTLEAPEDLAAKAHPEFIANAEEGPELEFCGRLKVKDDAAATAALRETLGSDQLWSSTTLLNHLRFLENLVPCWSESAIRPWINPFLYRVSTMIPNHLRMALSVEQVVPAVTVDSSLHTVSGFVAAVMDPAKLVSFLERPVFRPDHTVFFVSEAKDVNTYLRKHIPQTLSEMLGCARHAEKSIVRGVVTNGRVWLFLILTLRDDGTASYRRSDELSIGNYELCEPSHEGVSLISAILAHWILHSHEPLDETTDLFEIIA